jgi:fumarate hydratase, class I
VASHGISVHDTGPAEWSRKIATGEFKKIPVTAG